MTQKRPPRNSDVQPQIKASGRSGTCPPKASSRSAKCRTDDLIITTIDLGENVAISMGRTVFVKGLAPHVPMMRAS